MTYLFGGKQYVLAQTPDFSLLATGVNTDLAISNANDLFGRDLDYGKTILFEFGVRHAFSQDMVLDVSAYNKDKVSDVTGRLVSFYDSFLGRPGTMLPVLEHPPISLILGLLRCAKISIHTDPPRGIEWQ
jgi:hypothetical protein